jgi:hypothetical protein
MGPRGSVVLEALFCKPEGGGFETRWGEYIFLAYLILPDALGRKEYIEKQNEWKTGNTGKLNPGRQAYSSLLYRLSYHLTDILS